MELLADGSTALNFHRMFEYGALALLALILIARIMMR
jgi:hypothetical protein